MKIKEKVFEVAHDVKEFFKKDSTKKTLKIAGIAMAALAVFVALIAVAAVCPPVGVPLLFGSAAGAAFLVYKYVILKQKTQEASN